MAKAFPSVVHPRYSVELDEFSEDRSNVGRVVALNTEMVNEDGLPTSIMVAIGDDRDAAKVVAWRLARLWNLMRDVPDDKLGDVVVMSKASVTGVMNGLKDVIDQVMEPITDWQPGMTD